MSQLNKTQKAKLRVVTYYEREEVREELRRIAYLEGHSNLSQLVRAATKAFTKRYKQKERMQ